MPFTNRPTRVEKSFLIELPEGRGGLFVQVELLRRHNPHGKGVLRMALEQRRLGTTGLEVTVIGFGALEIGRDWGIGSEDDQKRPTEDEASRVLHGVLDEGINLIDTARAYHRSEERIGNALAGRRREYILASKCGEHSKEPDTYYDFTYEAVRNSIDLSLRLLQTNYIDIMQIHFGPDPARVLATGETLRAMREAQDAGKVGFLGASPPPEIIDACIESSDFDVIQVDYNLLDRSAEPLIEKAAERGIGVLVRSGLARGALTPRILRTNDPLLRAQVEPLLDLVGRDASLLPALAIAFLQSNPAVSSILVGSKQLENVQANIQALHAGVDPGLLDEAIQLTQPSSSTA